MSIVIISGKDEFPLYMLNNGMTLNMGVGTNEMACFSPVTNSGYFNYGYIIVTIVESSSCDVKLPL